METKQTAQAPQTVPPEIREIPGHAGYYCSPDGSVFSVHGWGLRRGKTTGTGELKRKAATITNYGYHSTTLVVGPVGARVRKRFNVHTLISLTFLGPPPKPGLFVRHMDGDRTNNRASNLRYGTPLQNRTDMIRCKSPWIKLTPKIVRAIRLELMEGETLRVLAAKYGCCIGSIHCIRHAITWRRVNCGLTTDYRRWLNQANQTKAQRLAARAC